MMRHKARNARDAVGSAAFRKWDHVRPLPDLERQATDKAACVVLNRNPKDCEDTRATQIYDLSKASQNRAFFASFAG